MPTTPSEHLRVTVLNTKFGDALEYRDTLDQMLPTDIGHLAVVGFSEVTPGVRSKIIDTIEARGYTAVAPDGDAANVDTLWAISPELTMKEPADKSSHRFTGRVHSRPGKRQKRHAGVQTIEFETPGGWHGRATTERLAPPIVGKNVRLRQLNQMETILDTYTPRDTTVDFDINGGDHNHANGPRPEDVFFWSSRGFTPLVAEGTQTFDPSEASRIVRTAGKVASRLGVLKSQQFDALYLRPGVGRSLVDPANATAPDEIGYTAAKVIPVRGTDHHAIQTTLTLPQR